MVKYRAHTFTPIKEVAQFLGPNLQLRASVTKNSAIMAFCTNLEDAESIAQSLSVQARKIERLTDGYSWDADRAKNRAVYMPVHYVNMDTSSAGCKSHAGWWKIIKEPSKRILIDALTESQASFISDLLNDREADLYNLARIQNKKIQTVDDYYELCYEIITILGLQAGNFDVLPEKIQALVDENKRLGGSNGK